MSALLLVIHKTGRRFESQNGSHMALFSAARASCFQRRRVRHNAIYVAYAQMPGCPLCSMGQYGSGLWGFVDLENAFDTYLGSQTSFGVTACCKRSVGKNRIYIGLHLGTKCAWTTLTDFCWKCVGTI